MTDNTAPDTAPDPEAERRAKRAASARKRAAAKRADRAPGKATGSTAKRAASSTSSAPPPEPNKGGRPSVRSKRAQNVSRVVGGLGKMVGAFDEFDGDCIIAGAPALGDALADLAESNPRVAKLLDGAVDLGASVNVISAVVAIIGPIVVHHGLFAALGPGDPQPEAERGDPPQPAPPATGSISHDPGPVFATRDGSPLDGFDLAAAQPGAGVSDDAPAFSIPQQ